MKRTRWPVVAATLACSGCSADIRDIGVAPHMTAVGSGLSANAKFPPVFDAAPARTAATRSLWDARGGDLFRDARAARVGDLITVAIAINDRATFGNSSDRSRQSTWTTAADGTTSSPLYTGKGDASVNVKSTSDTKGVGNIDRSEKIQLSVAAAVTEVLPNGNLLISGSQEVRVNFELRELTVSGIVRPRDVSRDNTIAYDKIAEARISYGGRGRITEVQQPALFQQIVDLIKPF